MGKLETGDSVMIWYESILKDSMGHKQEWREGYQFVDTYVGEWKSVSQ